LAFTPVTAFVMAEVDKGGWEEACPKFKEPSKYFFPTPNTDQMSDIIDFHNDLMMVLIFVLTFVVFLTAACLALYSTTSITKFYALETKESRINHDSTLETIFTVVPAAIISLSAMPSFALLYSNSDWLDVDYDLGLHITGHQWY